MMFRLILSLLCVASAIAAWSPPTGIPHPTNYWGSIDPIEATVPSQPAEWPSAPASGYYYVDRNHGSAQDGTNTYGFPDVPRLTVPTSLAAGDYVEVHGTGYALPTTWTLSGASNNIVTIYSPTNTAQFGTASTNQDLEIRGQWYRLIGLSFTNSKLRFGRATLSDARYGALVSCKVWGFKENNSATGIISFNSPATNHQAVVIYDCDVYDNGDLTNTNDLDHHGVQWVRQSQYLYLVDSRLYRNAGDGIQINANSGANQPTLNHCYVGRNVFYENKQNGFWLKYGTDIIFSENESYDHRPSTSSPGAGGGQQYGPERVWYLNNILHDCDVGIRIASDSDGHGTNVFIVGNLFYDIGPLIPTYDVNNNQTAAAIAMWDVTDRFVVNNTIWNCCAGIKNSSGAVNDFHLIGNIIGQHTYSTDREIWVPSISGSGSTMNNNVVIGDRISWDTDTVRTLAQFISDTGLGSGCSTNTPSFTDQPSNDYTLAEGDTAAIDLSVAPDVYSTFSTLYGLSITNDIAGVARPSGSAWDIGAYEFINDTNAPAISADSTTPTSQTTASAVWTTDETCNTNTVTVWNAAGTNTFTASNGTSHTAAITGLTASTLYTNWFVSVDLYDNATTNSAFTFTTLASTNDPTLTRVRITGGVTISGGVNIR